MPKLSIIIPVYNVEQYLRKCLDSVVNQTYKNLEIIIINDASPDNSQQIIDEYKNRDNRIISIINNPNIGLGATRNIGIDISSGEYMTFVDSDDWLELEMYEEMMNSIIKNRADVVECNAKNSYDNSNCIKHLIPLFKKSTQSIDKYILHLTRSELWGTVWNKIYKSDIVLINKIKFAKNKKIYAEDILFNLKIMHHVNFIITINKPFYNYNVRSGSITQNKEIFSVKMNNAVINSYIEDNKDYYNFKNDFCFFSILMIQFIVYNALSRTWDSKEKIKDGITILKNIREDETNFYVIKSCLENKRTKLKDKLTCLLISLKMYYIFISIYLIYKKFKKYA